MPSGIKQFFGALSGWAIVLCLLGAATVFLPWRFYALLPAFTPEWRGLPATATWHGIAVAAVYGFTGLVLIATFSPSWLPAWKPCLPLLAGAFGLVGAALYALQPNVVLIDVFNGLMPSGARVTEIVPDYHAFGPGFYGAIGIGVALLLLAALQFRMVLFGHSPGHQQPPGPSGI